MLSVPESTSFTWRLSVKTASEKPRFIIVNLKKYYSGNQLSLLLRKGVYPYNYVDCMKKLDETSLPPKEAIYTKLTGEGITNEDYQHAQTVWK